MAKQIRVLIVDDLSDWRKTLAGLLSKEGYIPETTATMRDALILSAQKQFDVAILDIRLDETDENNIEGLELAEKIKHQWPNVAIIMLTGYDTSEVVRQALEPNARGQTLAVDLISKTEVEALLSVMDRLLDAGKHIPTFEPTQECEIAVSLEPSVSIIVRHFPPIN